MFTTRPETQIEIDRLCAMLTALPIREIASYIELSDKVGYSVQRHALALIKARTRVEEETGMRFETVRGEGVRKIDGAAVASIGAAARVSISKRAKRQSARLTGLRYNDIDATTQAQIDAERSLLGAISTIAKTNVDAIEKETATGPIVASRIFDMMNRPT